MSLAIEVDRVTQVLIADGWHPVRGNSFQIDAYEFMWREGLGETPMLGGGQESLVPSAGFSFSDDHGMVVGPLTSIIAIRYTE